MSRTKKSTAAQKPHVVVLEDRCAGCQECLVRCPTGAISMTVGAWIVAADDELCTGCRQCVRACPFSAITVAGPVLAGTRTELHHWHPESLLGDHHETRLGITSWDEVIGEASRCLLCPDPTCVRGCPAHNDIPGFIASLREGNLDEARETLRPTTMLTDVCSRVCDQALQCEGSCTWSLAGDIPVAIGALERFVADNAPVPVPQRRSREGVAMCVAVVGSGPAGLAAAWDLFEAGAEVTIFERDGEPGGLLRWGIPDFTLPSTVALRSASALAEAGVTFRFEVEVGGEMVERLLREYDAIVLAVGAGMPLRLNVSGIELDGVWDATHFLTRAADVWSQDLGLEGLDPALDNDGHPATILVLGAGNTAMDVARTARRFGARVLCVDWMDRRFAPVRPDELLEAEEEGVEIRFCTTLEHLEGVDGRVATAHLLHTTQKSATSKPVVNSKAPDILAVDMVVIAMGYRIDASLTRWLPDGPVAKSVPMTPDRRWLGGGLLTNPSPAFARGQAVGRLALGRETARLQAGYPRSERVWAAGDALTGPATVVEAMAQGKQAARGILREQPRRGPLAQEPQLAMVSR